MISSRLRRIHSVLFVGAFSLIGFSCAQYNSSTYDAGTYSNGSNEVDPNFAPAFELIKNKCASCHDQHGVFSTYTSNAAWIATNFWITPGNANGSHLLSRSAQNPQHNNLNPMPPTGALSNAEYNLISTWIQNLTP